MSGTPPRPRLTRDPAAVVAIAGQPSPDAPAGQDHVEPADTPAVTPNARQSPGPAAAPASLVPVTALPTASREEVAPATTYDVLPQAWERVVAAGFSAKRESRSWTPYTPRLPETTWAALEARKLADARRTGDYGIAVAHYLQVAFECLPRLDDAIDATAAARAGLAWIRSAGHPGALVPTGSRITKTMKTQMQDLGLMLKGQQPKVELWVVQAAYVQALLDALQHDMPGI